MYFIKKILINFDAEDGGKPESDPACWLPAMHAQAEPVSNAATPLQRIKLRFLSEECSQWRSFNSDWGLNHGYFS